MPKRPLRLIYTAGPGNIIGTFRHWRAGHDDPTQVAMTYSGQFYDVCRDLDAYGYAIGSHPSGAEVKDGRLRIVHRPKRLAEASGALFHLGHFCRALWMIGAAIRYRADALVIGDNTCHWFPLRVLPWFGIAVIPTIHCVFWTRNHERRGRVQRILRHLERRFWSRSAASILCASPEIGRQVGQLAAGAPRPRVQFLPTYRAGTFAATPAPARVPFRILFAGRIEANKGVFDLLQIASRLRESGRTEVIFDLCGNGTALEELRGKVTEQGLTATFLLHGHCDRTTMKRMFEQCHVVVVPTTTQFVEGFNQVVVEAVLAGRPVITSDACPALEFVRGAVVEVPADDVNAYYLAIVQLLQDSRLYEQKCAACPELQPQFYDPAHGWAAALTSALRASLPAMAYESPMARPGPGTP